MSPDKALTTLGDFLESGRDLFWRVVEAGPEAHHFVPEWPAGFDRWESFIVILALGLFKFYRATVLKRRSHYIDRFGWSIILFDYVFAFVFCVSILFSLYPELRHINISRGMLLLLLGVTIWQAAEVWRADTARVEITVGGTNGTPGDDAPPSQERRTHYRRLEDRQLRGLE